MKELKREEFKLIAKNKSYKRKLNQAISALQKAINTCDNPAVSFSFGKDSVVCVDIARRIKSDILIINIDRGEGGDLQEAVDLYDKYAKKYNLNYHRVKTPKEILEIYRDADSLYDLRKKDLKNNLIKGIKKARNKFDIECEIMGLRAEESKNRNYLRIYGTLHYSKNEKIYKCKPVLHWTGREIWAYIVDNDVPYISWYDKMAELTSYEKARYSNWAGLFMARKGRFWKLKQNYPDEFNMLSKIFPEVRNYV
jgi:3'-phosphoadenosine 5'-phosphosulfate sulfotransferase (PAPS reductase)/FAD synthetase